MVGKRLGYPKAIQFVHSLVESSLRFEWVTQTDIIRVGEIMEKYGDAQLDFVDATLMAVAERLNITRIWTFDRRDFMMVRPAHTPFFEIFPE